MLNLSTYKNNDLNQFYHPTSIYQMDSQDIVYSQKIINLNKFVPILLKEWFFLVKDKGLLVIDYEPNNFADSEKLEKYMKLLWKNKFKLIYHGTIDNKEIKNITSKKIFDFVNNKKNNVKGSLFRFICQKIKSTSLPNDDISKWTFGIITNGKRNEWVEQILESIRKQKIPNYEIIICGTYSEKIKKDTIYIPFNKHDDKGWITKKKNLIVKRAKFENICMLHDRMVLGSNWYRGMKKWGNCFENLGCHQEFGQERVNDWLASHYFIESREGENFSFESYVDYKDWYTSIFFLGQLNIFKKSIILKNQLLWNESLFYGQREDYHFSSNLNKHGFIHRFNNFSTVKTLTHKYISPTYIKCNPYSLKPSMKLNNSRAFFKLAAYLFFKTLNILGVKLSFKALENIRGRIYTVILMFNPSRYSFNREWRKVVK